MIVSRSTFSSLLLLLVCAATAGAQSSIPSSSQPAADPAVAHLVHQLNDPDPQVRERATNALWSRGPSVEPALRVAAEGGPPEVVRRAKSILRDFAFGLYP